jgi:hypothetical protein
VFFRTLSSKTLHEKIIQEILRLYSLPWQVSIHTSILKVLKTIEKGMRLTLSYNLPNEFDLGDFFVVLKI